MEILVKPALYCGALTLPELGPIVPSKEAPMATTLADCAAPPPPHNKQGHPELWPKPSRRDSPGGRRTRVHRHFLATAAKTNLILDCRNSLQRRSGPPTDCARVPSVAAQASTHYARGLAGTIELFGRLGHEHCQTTQRVTPSRASLAQNFVSAAIVKLVVHQDAHAAVAASQRGLIF